MSVLLEPFNYHYMTSAMWVSALVGGVCAFLSVYLMVAALVPLTWKAWKRWLPL